VNGRTLVPRGLSILLGGALILASGCARKGAPVPSADEPRLAVDSTDHSAASRVALSIRFAIELGRGVEGPVYVMLNDEDDQPGWVRSFRDGERMYLRERCEIEDCGVPPVVCGAAIPLVRDIKGTASLTSIEFVWDGMTSVLDPASGCETRRPAGAGDYVARFCFSRRAEFYAEGDPTVAIPGGLVDPTCVERRFTLRDQQVVLRIPPVPLRSDGR